MPSLPTGTVTFLFTDIEGSTTLLQRLGDRRYAEVLAEHQRLLRDAFAQGHGQEIDTQGDAFLVAFSRARDALGTAVAAQLALTKHAWPDGASLRVRMGLHSGEPVSGTEGYVGLDVHRAARICSAGHGGMILLSDAVSSLAARDLPLGVSLRDLGIHRLKDLREPEHLLQVVHPDLPADFPSLKSLDVLPNNLPRQLTSFIGRDREMAEVRRLLSTTGLLTLTGDGGCGKTRLALQVVADLVDEYPDGVWLVELAALSDPALVPKVVASALDVPEQAGRSLDQGLADFLSSKSLLVVLDNCEHLVNACAELTSFLLRSCPALRVLATSRQPLGIDGEVIWRVPSMSVPESTRIPPREDLARYEGVRLFVERAASSHRGFAITERNAPAIAQVCIQLDGIPLAIELAAARVKVLSVEQIVARLNDRFRLLAGGGRTKLPRHQTLRATMDWSYGLLSKDEQAMLRRLSVFAGGWTLEAAEAAFSDSAAESTEVLNLLAQLVDKSLVQVENQADRAWYRLLETVRQYGQDRLVESNEVEGARRRHADWYLALAEQATVKLRGPEQKEWVDRLEVERDNLRAALQWSATEPGGADAGLRLAVALHWFWFMRNHLSEGRQWLERFLASSVNASNSSRATALFGIGLLARRQGDYKAAEPPLRDSVALFRESGDQSGIGLSLHHLAHVADESADSAKAVALFEESLGIFREAANTWGVAASLNCLGETLQHRGDYSNATPMLRESLRLCREIGDRWLTAYPTRILGIVAANQGEYEGATGLLEESLAIERETGDKWGEAQSLSTLASIACNQQNYERAAILLNESLILRRDVGSKPGIAECLERLGMVFGGQGHLERAARLLGAAEALREAIGALVPLVDRADYDRAVATVRSGSAEKRLGIVWAEGRAMTLEQAIEYALAVETGSGEVT